MMLLNRIPILLTLSSALNATTIVILRDRSVIFIGTDSKGTYSENKKQVPVQAQCKLLVTPRFAFAAGGTVATTSGFSAYRTARSLGDSTEPLDTIFIRLCQQIESEVRRLIPKFRRELPAEYRRMLLGDRGIVSVLLAGSAPAAAQAFACRWELDPKGNLIKKEIRVPDREITVLGATVAFQEWIKNNRIPNGATNAILKVLAIEADGEPDLTARPFSVLKVNPNGMDWIHKGICK